MMAEIYKWKPGFVHRIDAEDAATEINRLLKQHPGQLTAEVIAEEARDPENPLHPQVFHLGIEEAAEQHYIHEAGELRRSLVRVVVTCDDPSEEVVVPAFVTLERVSGDGQHRRVERSDVAMGDSGMRRLVLGQVRSAISQLKNKLTSLGRLGEMSPVLGRLSDVAEEAMEEIG